MKKCFKKLLFGLLSLSLVFGFSCVSGAEAEKDIALKSVPQVSIIMPVYNVEPYLDEALDSAENQTLKDMEIICVNDGSTDNSQQILEKHAKKDNRIKIISQENQGLSEARNVGFKASMGKYIYFCDSDDIMAPYAMEKALENLEKYDADVLEMGIKKFPYGNSVNLSEYSYKDLPITVCEYKKDCNPFKVFQTKTSAVWSYVYRKSFLTENNLTFKKEVRTHEDVLFTYLVKTFVKKLVKDPNIGYFHRLKRPGSIIFVDDQDVHKRINGFLGVVHELAQNKAGYDFPSGKEYMLGKMLNLLYSDIKSLKEPMEKGVYAGKAFKEIWLDFGKKNEVKPGKHDKKRLDDLKTWFQDAQKDFKAKQNEKKIKQKKQAKQKIQAIVKK